MSIIGDILKQINTDLLTITDIKVANLWINDPYEVSTFPTAIVRAMWSYVSERKPSTDYKDEIILDLYNTGGIEGITTLAETIEDIFIKDYTLADKCHRFGLTMTLLPRVNDAGVGQMQLKYELLYSRDYPITP